MENKQNANVERKSLDCGRIYRFTIHTHKIHEKSGPQSENQRNNISRPSSRAKTQAYVNDRHQHNCNESYVFVPSMTVARASGMVNYTVVKEFHEHYQRQCSQFSCVVFVGSSIFRHTQKRGKTKQGLNELSGDTSFSHSSERTILP